jgi:hypothetical protein
MNDVEASGAYPRERTILQLSRLERVTDVVFAIVIWRAFMIMAPHGAVDLSDLPAADLSLLAAAGDRSGRVAGNASVRERRGGAPGLHLGVGLVLRHQEPPAASVGRQR